MADQTGELAFIQWVRQQSKNPTGVKIGPGDDAAVLCGTGAADLLVTTDMLLDGSCFRLDEAGPRRVGRKAMAVNLSDIAAMAGQPLAAVVSVGLPRAAGQSVAIELFLGMKEMADRFQLPIVGGDTNTWDGPLSISITMLGLATNGRAVLRSHAQPGDWLFVTGPLGGSILGHHLDFTPRVAEALSLHNTVNLHAMIDISDGFALDLHRLCQESGCGAIIDSEKIPINEAAQNMKDSKSGLDHALGDGEDFELLFAVDPGDGEVLSKSAPVPVFYVGKCSTKDVLLTINGVPQLLPRLGFEHKFTA